MAQELKPCKQCGSKNVELKQASIKRSFWVQCKDCGNYSSSKMFAASAISEWNK